MTSEEFPPPRRRHGKAWPIRWKPPQDMARHVILLTPATTISQLFDNRKNSHRVFSWMDYSPDKIWICQSINEIRNPIPCRKARRRPTINAKPWCFMADFTQIDLSNKPIDLRPGPRTLAYRSMTNHTTNYNLVVLNHYFILFLVRVNSLRRTCNDVVHVQ